MNLPNIENTFSHDAVQILNQVLKERGANQLLTVEDIHDLRKVASGQNDQTIIQKICSCFNLSPSRQSIAQLGLIYNRGY